MMYSESSVRNANYGAEKAVNGTLSSTHTGSNATTPHWLQYEFPTAVVVFQYRIWAAPDATYKDAPIDWKLQGSHSGSNWQDLDVRNNSQPPNTSGLGLTSNSLVTLDIPHGKYEVANPGLYSYYRLSVTRTGGGTSNRNDILKVAELEFIGQ